MAVDPASRPSREVYGELNPDPQSSHQVVLRAVGTGKKVLDVGCGAGFLAAAIQAAGNTCTGIENHPRRAEEARGRGIEVVSWDLERGLPPLQAASFDCIVFADVLEHLAEPLFVLAASRSLLASGGRILVSVPNVANFKVRAMLLKGQWVCEDEGIMDRTHLRWFTRQTVLGLLAEAGFEPEALHYVPDFPFARLLAGLPGRALGLVRRASRLATDLLPELFAFQIILVARPRGSAGAAQPGQPSPSGGA